ncbi:MAG: DUF481 domain-containing protein [bacterium]
MNSIRIPPASSILAVIAVIFLLSAGRPAAAQDADQDTDQETASDQKPAQNQKPKKWTLQYDLGYRQTSGNETSHDLRTELKVTLKRPKDDLRLTSSYARGEADGEVSADRRDFLAKYNRLFIKKAYWSAFLFYERDRVRDIKRRRQIGPAIGARFYDTEELFFSSDVGAVWDETTSDESGDTDSELKGLWNVDFSYVPLPDLKFEEKIRWVQDLKTRNFEISSETSAYVPLYKKLFLKIGLTDNYVNEPQKDRKKNDLTILTSLSYVTHF